MSTNSTIWQGVLPAATTPFTSEGKIDYAFLEKHLTWMYEAGCTGMVPHGSLGESATLSFEEKSQLQKAFVKVSGKRPVVPGIASLSTAEAVALAKEAEQNGCQGLMVLPAYGYSTDWREIKAHVSAVIQATPLPVLLYNNPVAYKTDFQPEHIAELMSEHPNIQAVKESSTDVRRVTAIRALLGNQIRIGVGVDDVLVEGVMAGAEFWIAGVVNAFPKESVQLFELARKGGGASCDALYHWMLPLLRMDTVPKFVQLIKLIQEKVGMGHRRVRGPRLEIVGDELKEAESAIEYALKNLPQI